MSNLTDRLPLTEGTNRVIVDQPGPSALGSFADFAAGAVHDYAQLKQDVAASNRSKVAAEKLAATNSVAYDALTNTGKNVLNMVNANQDARDDYEQLQQPLQLVNPVNQLSVEIPGLNGDASTVMSTSTPPAVVQGTVAAGRKVQSIVAAVDQGKMPAISKEAAFAAEFQRQVEAHKGNAGDVLDIWKKMGIDTTQFRAGRDLASDLDAAESRKLADQEGDRKWQETLLQAGMTAVGPAYATGSSVNPGGPMTREELIAHGLDSVNMAHNLDIIKTKTEIAASQATATEAQRRQAQEDGNNKIDNIVSGDLYDQSLPFINGAQHLFDSIQKGGLTAENIAKFQQFGGQVHAAAGNWVEHAIQVARQSGSTVPEETLRTRYQGQYKRFEDLFTGDFSLVNQNMKALQGMQTATGLKINEVLPIYSALKTAGLHPETMQEVIGGLSPDLKKGLYEEIKGYNTDLGSDKASTHILNIARIVKGEATLTQMDPDHANKILPGLANTSEGLAKNYVRGIGNVDDYINTAGEVIIATRKLGPESSTRNLEVATAAFANPNHIAAMVKAAKDPKADQDMVRATVVASRGASAGLLKSLHSRVGQLNSQNQYYEIKWNTANGNYQVVDDKRVNALRAEQAKSPTQSYNPITGGAVGVAGGLKLSTLQNMQPPKEMTQLANAANANLNNLVKLGEFDPSTPKGMTIREERDWYGRGIVPKALRDQQHQNVDAQHEIDTQFNALGKMLDDNSTRSNVPVGSKYNDSALAPVVTSAASRYGVPHNIALNLVGQESGFNPNKPGIVIDSGTHKGDRAKGLGQVMGKTAAAYGVTDRDSLTPEQQADLSMHILSDNYKKTGNWRDAVAMYHSGKTYAKATGGDGLIHTRDYVDNILGG